MPLPKKATAGSVAFDLYSRAEVKIKPGEISLLPSNFIIKVPPGLMLMLAPRSSLAKKLGLIMPNSIGIIDQDYCGESDEILIQVYNFTKKKVVIKKSERIAQAIFVKIDTHINWRETDKIKTKSRGGFGSTG